MYTVNRRIEFIHYEQINNVQYTYKQRISENGICPKKKYKAILSSSKMKKRIQGDFIFVYKIQIYKRATETFRRNKKYHQQS